MKNIKSSKTFLKILSALIAIVLWFAITYTEDPVISQPVIGLKLTVKGESTLNASGFAIVNKDSFPAISVVIRGSRSDVISALGEISAEIDVSSIKQEGETVVAVTYSYPSSRVMLEKARVREITVKTEGVATREIPVKTEALNRDKNRETLVKTVCKTETITVKGAISDVNQISYAKAKFDASKITKTSEMECPYEFYNEDDEVLTEENIIYKSKETILLENTVYERVTLPIKVILDSEKRKDYGFLLKNISAESVDVGLDDGVSAEYIEAQIIPQKEKNSYEAVLVAPEGVYIPEENTRITVSGEIAPKETADIAVKVTPVNVPSGKKVTVSPSEMTVTVKTAENISKISVKATVDVSEMTEMEEILPLTFETSGDADIIGTYRVTVKAEQGE